jgi:hypothetical protein
VWSLVDSWHAGSDHDRRLHRMTGSGRPQLRPPRRAESWPEPRSGGRLCTSDRPGRLGISQHIEPIRVGILALVAVGGGPEEHDGARALRSTRRTESYGVRANISYLGATRRDRRRATACTPATDRERLIGVRIVIRPRSRTDHGARGYSRCAFRPAFVPGRARACTGSILKFHDREVKQTDRAVRATAAGSALFGYRLALSGCRRARAHY